MKAYKIFLFLIYVFDVFYAIYGKEYVKIPHITGYFYTSIGFWAVFAVFLFIVHLSQDKIMKMITGAFEKFFENKENEKEKFIKKGKLVFSVNLIALSCLIILFAFKNLYIACGIITAFTLLYSTFINKFLKTIEIN